MAIDWTNLFKRYKGKWVALESDEMTVISSGKTAKTAYEKAIKSGHDKPILTHVPNDLMPYVGSGV